MSTALIAVMDEVRIARSQVLAHTPCISRYISGTPATFPLLHYVVEDYPSRVDFVKGGWPDRAGGDLHPWQARAKQMSHCHAKGSPLCDV